MTKKKIVGWGVHVEGTSSDDLYSTSKEAAEYALTQFSKGKSVEIYPVRKSKLKRVS